MGQLGVEKPHGGYFFLRWNGQPLSSTDITRAFQMAFQEFPGTQLNPTIVRKTHYEAVSFKIALYTNIQVYIFSNIPMYGQMGKWDIRHKEVFSNRQTIELTVCSLSVPYIGVDFITLISGPSGPRE